jgi:hypothetical protein
MARNLVIINKAMLQIANLFLYHTAASYRRISLKHHSRFHVHRVRYLTSYDQVNLLIKHTRFGYTAIFHEKVTRG